MKWSFKSAMQKLAEKATKLLYEVKLHNLSIQCHLDLFDKIVQPILLILLGFTNFGIIERIYLNFCKQFVLNLKQ